MTSIAAAVEVLNECGIPDRDSAVYSSMVPKTVTANLRWRKSLLELAAGNPAMQDEIWIMCARDPLFFINSFCYLLETRDRQEWNTNIRYGDNKVLPFITREYQDTTILQSIQHLGKRDIVVPKSRETGVSWIFAAAIAVWDWMFHEQTHIGFVSKDLLSANNPDDPDALFSKFEFLLTRLPLWLQPKYERNIAKNTFKNEMNDSSVTAYPAKADLGRGGRKSWMLKDEFHFFAPGEDYAALDSTIHVTPCRVFVSTANRERGQAGAFYDMVVDDTRSGVQIVIDWKDDVDKRRGLYHSECPPGSEIFHLAIDDVEFWSQYANGDGTYRHPTQPGKNYPFILDERTRSLYYDHVWNRPGSTPQSVSAELDRNFGGATSQIFNPSLLARALANVKRPLLLGDISRHPEKINEFLFDPLMAGGLTTLWCPLIDGKPPVSEYCFGVDISMGVGGEWSSYSALEGIDKKTGEQIFEWRSNRLDPVQFAELAVWVCRWFYNAYLVPEINGPGQLFMKRVNELKYANVYHELTKRVSARKVTERVGYYNSDKGVELIKAIETGIRTKQLIVNSEVVLKEAGRYFMKRGYLVHSAEQVSDDGAGQGEGHGDAAIALGCAMIGVKDWPTAKEAAETGTVPEGCALWRRQQWLNKQKKAGQKSYWSPSYT